MLIHYRNPERLPHQVIFLGLINGDAWQDIANRTKLPLISQFGSLEFDQAEDAQQLIRELLVARKEVIRPGQDYVHIADVEAVYLSVDRIVPVIEQAISEWQQVASITIG